MKKKKLNEIRNTSVFGCYGAVFVWWLFLVLFLATPIGGLFNSQTNGIPTCQ